MSKHLTIPAVDTLMHEMIKSMDSDLAHLRTIDPDDLGYMLAGALMNAVHTTLADIPDADAVDAVNLQSALASGIFDGLNHYSARYATRHEEHDEYLN